LFHIEKLLVAASNKHTPKPLFLLINAISLSCRTVVVVVVVVVVVIVHVVVCGAGL
jgi:hypothetical protein